MNQEETVIRQNPDLEVIHMPGFIQPHGAMLVLSKPQLTILQVSDNCYEFFGRQTQELLHQNLTELLNDEQINSVKSCLAEDFESVNPLGISIAHPQGVRWFDAIIHHQEQIIILELEPAASDRDVNFFDFYHWVKKPIAKMQNTSSLIELCRAIVTEIRQITDFDRVMVYQFNEEEAGKVIAENKRDDLDPYLDLHYPAFDIPSPARQLYSLKPLRIIPDANYQPVKVVPEINPITNQPLDMSLAELRSVSPCHIEYLHNMGVTASMSISLLKDKKLWGLVACHHHSPKRVSYRLRTVCEFLAQGMSFELSAKEDHQDLDYKIKLKSIQSELLHSISKAKDYVTGLNQTNLLKLVEAEGAVVCIADKLTSIGNTPTIEELPSLISWVENNIEEDRIYYTNSLSVRYPAAEEYQAVASGLLALCLSKVEKFYVLWFRPEVIQTVNWGGNPNQVVEIATDSGLRLSPRKSFSLWQETVRGKSLPWKTSQLEIVRELGNAIVGLVLRQAEELAKINRELQRSNQELDAFAYIASHDLKEPLRGIHNYSSFLLQDYAELLNQDGVDKLQTLVRLTQHMEDLINSLLQFSRLGREALSIQPTDLNTVVKSVLDIFTANAQSTDVEFCIPRSLPTVYCDRIQVKELFTNLISNAIKYNDKLKKRVEIGFLDSEPNTNLQKDIVFYIKDNGIGIREKHLKTIFRIFKRLHPRDRYGGGTGAGLTIAQKIVERHNGKIWVESTYGEGTIFYFTLPN